MKNIYLLYLLICSLCTFTACSDDDKDIIMAELPVTNLNIPATIKQGETLLIEGKGFNEQSRIYLKSVSPLKVEATISGNTGLSVSIPEDLETGIYFIILQQGDLWEIGRVRVLSGQGSPILGLNIPGREFTAGETITIEGKGFSEECRISLLSSTDETDLEIIERTENGITVQLSKMQKAADYILLLRQGEQWELGSIQINAYVQTDFRIKEIIKNNSETTTLTYNDEGKVESILIVGSFDKYQYKFNYAEEEISVEATCDWGDGWQPDDSWTYQLNNGQISSHIIWDETYNWSYTEDNQLKEISNGEFSTVTYTYDNGNLVQFGTEFDPFSFSYTGEISNYEGGVNVMSLVIFQANNNKQEFFAGLLNLSGQSSTLLPNSATIYDEVKECSYDTMDNGYIKKVTIGSDSFELKYE